MPWQLGNLAPSPLASWLCQEPSPWPPWHPEIPEMRRVHQFNRSKDASFVGGGTKFENTVLSGAIAIYIPKEYAPLVAGRWNMLQDQHATCLNKLHPSRSRKDWIALRISVQDYYAYIELDLQEIRKAQNLSFFQFDSATYRNCSDRIQQFQPLQ